MQRIDPDSLIVVTAWRALECRPGAAAVFGFVRRRPCREHDVRVLGMHAYVDVEPLVVAHALPRRARIVRSIHGPVPLRGNERVEAMRIALGNRERDATEPLRTIGETARQFVPGDGAVGGLVQAAVRSDKTAVLPRRFAMIPQRRVHDRRIRRIDLHLRGARVAVDEQRLVPGAAAVGGPKHAALVVGTVGMAHPCHEHDVRVRGVDNDAADLLDVAQADVPPRSSAVGGFEDPVTDAQVGTMEALAAADVDDLWIRGRDGDVANRTGWRRVEDRMPRAAVVVGFPHAAVVGADKEHSRLRRHADTADRAARAERSDQAIAELLIERRIDSLHVTGALCGRDARAGSDQQQQNGAAGWHRQSESQY